ncbi:MAG: FAD-dependent oxidoreductase [Candidatus Muproteobacteria bacterium RIFCSPHIGHO2_01_FULL_65_16]|uniref:FAD-dependent oxidoreductase n=1 Tax=Candidatus Muproteobacteria bacterium RIFCSPHIGHO2_01_FULL_65_16 TaxID=1817764 RepID=A0A1F6TKX7_9PROT|nr:MAG: FAD-dependent oxidoreductase [Candidatus Muproteobacteria bacterium RIFCSPHIGHO2_01_FULL_65_16]
MLPRTTDFLVIGGGIVGVTVAAELKHRHPRKRVTLIEKEDAPGRHASGRNSGVLHAGFYYAADSLKARFTRDGNRRLTEYCLGKRLRINRCGKLVVARNEAELSGLSELLRRGRQNGVELHEIGLEEAQAIEPRVRTHERALWSPTTATVDPGEVLHALVEDARVAGVEIHTGARFCAVRGRTIVTSRGALAPGYVINAAGLYADRVAHAFGFARHYRILPFKGLYLYSEEPPGALRTNIYPVPDLGNPFLGVHFTVGVDGRGKIGPTAIPAFWREHYRGLHGFRPAEFVEIVWRELTLLVRNDFRFRELAWEELRKYRRRRLVALAAELADGVRQDQFRRWGRPGIRAQLLDIVERRLEFDFRYEGDGWSLHVLNAVSPAFTCALPFAAHLADEIERRLGGAGHDSVNRGMGV